MSTETVKDIQLKQLKKLLRYAPNTWWGRQLGLHRVQSYEEFRNVVPIHDYEDLRPLIDRMKKGEADVTWPGTVERFAVSAGTTGTGKHLPVTENRLQSDRKFMRRVIWSYIRRRPALWSWLGAQASLPGTLEEQSTGDHCYTIGEISGYLAELAPFWVRPLQVASPLRLARMPFQQKFETVLHNALKRNLRIINGVPSWILTLFQRALKETGFESIAQVWPNLQLLVCGGVKLERYRPQLERLCEGLNLDFIENYGASEGYFSFSDDFDRNDMRLIADNGLFFEWLPFEGRAPRAADKTKALPTWQVKTGRPYIMLVSSNAGLWRYAVNDIITFTQKDPPRIEVTGRVAEMLDEFGEALYGWEAEKALKKVLEKQKLGYSAFTICGVFGRDDQPPYHHWLVLFDHYPSREQFTKLPRKLDQQLRQLNRHYAIRRESGALGAPKIHAIDQQQVNQWFLHSGKRQAQAKLPRMLHRRDDIQWWLKTLDATRQPQSEP